MKGAIRRRWRWRSSFTDELPVKRTRTSSHLPRVTSEGNGRSEATTPSAAQPLTTMPATKLRGAAKCARRKTHRAQASDTHESPPQEAIPGLPDHLVVTHILRSQYFDDPADLARLRVVSPAMRDAVTATGLKIEEIDDDSARRIGCLSALRRWQRRGQLSNANEKYMCEAAALSSAQRTAGGAEIVARNRMPMEREDVRMGGVRWSP